jgi:hypothetical protein
MNSQYQADSSLPSWTVIFRFNGAAVVVQPAYWPIIVLVTGFLAWLAGKQNPARTWRQRLGVALLAMPVAVFADVGHAMAHTISARMAKAPMDEILLSASMPRTLYKNNDVPARTHIQRSLGGPIFSLISFLLSLLWRRLSPRGTLSHDLAVISLFSHSEILLGSISPLPMVDGGIILKWKLVEAGQTPRQADQTVRKISLGLGSAVLGLGAVLGIIGKRRLIGGLLAAGGAAAVAAGLDWLK